MEMFNTFLTCGNVATPTCCVPASCCAADYVKKSVSDFRINWDWRDYLLTTGERAITSVTWGVFDANNDPIVGDEITLVSSHHDPYSDRSAITVRGGLNGRQYKIYLRGTSCPGCVQEQVCFGLSITDC